MLFCLGRLVFKTSNLPLQNMQRQNSWKHPKADRTGARPAYQFTGEDDDTVQLSGLIMPEFGNQNALTELRKMAKEGLAYTLARGNGDILGMFAITSLSETSTLFKHNGDPRRIEFNMSLLRVDNDLYTYKSSKAQ